jgi:hypothetical protein
MWWITMVTPELRRVPQLTCIVSVSSNKCFVLWGVGGRLTCPTVSWQSIFRTLLIHRISCKPRTSCRTVGVGWAVIAINIICRWPSLRSSLIAFSCFVTFESLIHELLNGNHSNHWPWRQRQSVKHRTHSPIAVKTSYHIRTINNYTDNYDYCDMIWSKHCTCLLFQVIVTCKGLRD